MASKKQKQELIDTLKFTPRTYSVQLYAYGGETYAGRVPREIYDFFKKHRIDMEQYASDWDDAKWEFVPEDMRPFPPGAPFECENLFHCSGATMDDSNHVEILDENGDTVWSCTLDPSALEDAGVQVDCFDEIMLSSEPEGTVIFWGGQGEKGSLFGGTFELRQPFDPAKLRITYEDCDGWAIANSVAYDEEDISNDDYSTTGKWAEAKWIIIGDEEVYQGVERDDDGNMVDGEEDEEPDYDHPEANFDDDSDVPVLENEETWASRVIDESMLSPWHPADAKPVHKGIYEVEYTLATWPFPISAKVEWTGRRWKHDRDGDTEIARWRGLNQPFEE